MFKISGATLWLLLFISCTSNNKYLLSVKKSKEGDKQLTIDSVVIPLPAHTLHQYLTFSVTEIAGNTYYLGYNATNVSLDIFNLDQASFVKQIQLSSNPLFSNMDKKDMDKSKSVADVLFLNFDSIFINLSNKRILLIDSSFRVKLNIEMATAKGVNHKEQYGMPVTYSHAFKMTYNRALAVLLMEQIFHDSPVKRPSFVQLDLKDTSLHSLPLYHSDYYYDKKGKMGMLSQTNVNEAQKDSLLTYNFTYESNIYQYNYQTQYITAYGGKSSLSDNIITPLMADVNEEMAWRVHLIESPQFFSVMYDKHRQLYYRFHQKEIPYENGKYFNSALDKELILMVFNKNFELEYEGMLPGKRYASYSWFVTSKGLYISPTHKKNHHTGEAVLKFNILNIRS